MIKELQQPDGVLKVTASGPLSKDSPYNRIVLRKTVVRGKTVFQAEMYTSTQVFHSNVQLTDAASWASRLEGNYKQICVSQPTCDVTYLTSKKGVTTRIVRATAAKNVRPEQHNRVKKYILNEGDDVPAMVDLGIFTKEGKVVAGMYDKFRQINRFTELDDVLKNHVGSLTLLDFGCGKSYLTFIVYHYLTNVRKIDAKVIGYDLKADVVEDCNALAAKYGYANLHFAVADVSRDKLYEEHIDAVLSLHACDTATDHALAFAVKHNVPYVFSVPCCQHEVNGGISAGGGDLDVLLKYGIVKARVSALLTDTIRAMLLEDAGYKVDVLEFVDLAHTPKNVMLRCVKTGKPSDRNAPRIKELIEKYRFEQTLYRLLKG